MVVDIHSFGSLWQTRERPTGVAIWNTTGVFVEDRLRSRAVTYGQVSLGRMACLEYAKLGAGLRGMWEAEVTSRGDACLVRLLRRSPSRCAPECSLVCATSGIVGEFTATETCLQPSGLVSLSSYKACVEALILMRPYGWVRGTRGSMTLLPNGPSFRLRVVRWK